MKKLLLLCALAFSLSIQAQDTSEFKTQTIEFIKLTGTTEAFDSAITQIGAMVPEDKKEAYMEEARGTLDDLYSQLADIYMKEFTQKEIAELTAFYQTELGKKLASKQNAMSQTAMSIGQSWGMELSQIAMRYSN